MIKKIKVKKHHILEGIPQHSSCCAIALAVKDNFPHYDIYVSERLRHDQNVMSYQIRIKEKNAKDCAFHTTKEPSLKVDEFISKFDSTYDLDNDREQLEPFEFDLKYSKIA